MNASRGGLAVVVNDVPRAELLAAPPRDPGGAGTRLDSVPALNCPYGGPGAGAGLRLEAGTDRPDGRRSHLVCSVCGDLDCGATSAIGERDGADIVWREFASARKQNDPEYSWHTPLAHVAPPRFEEAPYRAALPAMLKASNANPLRG